MSGIDEPALEQEHIAAVVPMSFYRPTGTYLVAALEILLGLNIGTVIVLRDRKDPYAHGVVKHVRRLMNRKFHEAGKELEFREVDTYGTSDRWRLGFVAAFRRPEIMAAFLFPGDMTSTPSDAQRTAWQIMLTKADRRALILGDYESPETERFKQAFDRLVVLPTLEILEPESYSAIRALGLLKHRTEFLIAGRDVFASIDQRVEWIWVHDAVPLLLLAALKGQHDHLRYEKVDLGYFTDDADTRLPLGQLEQILRFPMELVLAQVVGKNKEPDTTRQSAVYMEMENRIARLFDLVLRVITANRAAIETESMSASSP
jgi:hypothetical protein